MPDTGAPWNIPYVTSTDLVSDWPADSLALANAIDAGLDAAGGLVDVHYVEKTDTFSSSSVAAGGNVAVTGLSLSNIALSNSSNRFIVTAFFGSAANSRGRGEVGIAVNNGTSFIAIGDAASNRTRVTGGGIPAPTDATFVVTMPHVTFIYAPGDTTARTYTVHAFNIDTVSRDLYVNRSTVDSDAASQTRTISALMMQEIKV